jgi:hypothetical protein
MLPIPYAGYLIVITLGVVLWLAGRRWPQRIAPLGRVTREILSSLPSRIAIALIWWWLGWHFFTN